MFILFIASCLSFLVLVVIYWYGDNALPHKMAFQAKFCINVALFCVWFCAAYLTLFLLHLIFIMF